MASSIYFHFEDLHFSLKNRKKVKDWLINTSLAEKMKIDSLNFIFCSDQHLLSINKQFLKHNYFTDVITFANPYGNGICGDVFISYDRVKENAKHYCQKTENELHRVMVHGLLHLLGYNDKKPEQQKVMKAKEDFYLSLRAF